MCWFYRSHFQSGLPGEQKRELKCACVITAQLTEVVKVFITGQIVANDVVGLPTAKQGEAWPDLHLHRVIQDLEMGGGDVANLISVVHILGRGGENSLGEKKKEYERKQIIIKTQEIGRMTSPSILHDLP